MYQPTKDNTNPLNLDIEIARLLNNIPQNQNNREAIEQFLLENFKKKTPKEERLQDEFNCISQWRLLLETLICIMKMTRAFIGA